MSNRYDWLMGKTFVVAQSSRTFRAIAWLVFVAAFVPCVAVYAQSPLPGESPPLQTLRPEPKPRAPVNVEKPVFVPAPSSPAAVADEPETEGEGAAENAAGTVDVVAPATGADRELFTALMAAEFALQDGRVESAAKHYARAALLSSDPKVAEQAARIALQADRADLAAQSLKRWRELSPQAGADIKAAEAGLALARGEIDEAVRGLRPLLGGSEDDRRALVQALLAPGSKPHLAAALDALAVGNVPGGADAIVLLSQVAEQVKDNDRAQRFADAAIAVSPDDADALVWRAHLRFAARDIKGGRIDMDRALAVGKDKKDLRFNYASMLSTIGEHAEADALLRDQPADDALLAARAAYAARSNDDARLREVYLALQKLPEPRPATRLELLANLAELQGEKQEALRWYTGIGATDERFLPSQLRVAILKNDLGQRKEALTMLRDLRAAGIDDQARLAETYMLEAEILRNDAKAAKTGSAGPASDEVLTLYDRAIKLLPEQRQLGYARAVYLESIGRIDEAVVDLRALLSKSPDDPDALNALGYTLADRTDKHAEALAFITRALEQKPDEPAIIDSMGWVLYRLGQNDKALEHLRRAWQMQPDPEVGAHLGELLWVSGDKIEARKIWQSAAERDAGNKVLAETRARLEK
ncbi:MAG: tetratricopeptide repeat protein [Lysobacterales bacterium]